MRLVLDVENSVTWRDGKIFNDPFEPNNTLTQVGMLNADNHDELHIVNLDHNDAKDTSGSGRILVQRVLDMTTLLIMHNARHDLMWLWESGFVYEGKIYDTMLAEYILLRGQKAPKSLSACAIRRELAEQKEDYLSICIKKGINTNETDLSKLSLYLRADLLTTSELFHSIEEDYAKKESASLVTVREVTFQTCKTLTRMYMSGIRVDLNELERVREQFEDERSELETRLQTKVRELMGDTPINLNSPEQVSQVVFSRKVKDKSSWIQKFDYQDSSDYRKSYHTVCKEKFNTIVNANTEVIKLTKAFTCPTCEGEGKTYKTKKDGTNFAKPNKCKDCDSRGFQLTQTQQVAGLRFSVPNKKWVSANGFSTSKENIQLLISTAKTHKKDEAVAFLKDYLRFTAIRSYLSTFVDGIGIYSKGDGFLHATLTQSVTATGRFSGKEPNMQNMPRGGTFPVKKVFVSRWKGGEICEADFAQLEFRTAAFLAQDEIAMEEINTGFDVHSYTAKVISDAGQPTTRQQAKEHTFAPLFGATGYGRSKAEEAYYIQFIAKYKGVAAWHKNLGEEAMRFNKITNVSGRQYAFPDITRKSNGSVSHFTTIKNYPVQGFATGDVVPVVLNEMHCRLESMKSCLVNTVHDSMVIDIHPDETEQVLNMINDMNEGLTDLIEVAYGIRMNVPLLLEAKIGLNWLDTVDV